MVRRGVAVLAAALCVLLTGCRAILPHAQDISQIKLMRTMAVDAGEEGEVKITVSGGLQKQSAGGETRAPVILSRTSPTVYGGCERLLEEGDGTVEFGHLAECIVGEEYARQGIGGLADFLERDISLRMETRLFVVLDAAGWEAVRGAASNNTALTDRLGAICRDQRLRRDRWVYTLREYISDQQDNGISLLPALTLGDNPEYKGGEGEDAPEKTVSCTGLVWLRDQRLEGVLTQQESRGAILLNENVRRDRYEITLKNGAMAGVTLTAARVSPVPEFAPDGTLRGITVKVKVSGDLSELSQWADVQDARVVEEIQREFARQVESACQAALDRSRGENADFLHLRRRLICGNPLQARWLAEGWENWFPGMQLRAEAECAVERSYVIADPAGEEETWTTTQSR